MPIDNMKELIKRYKRELPKYVPKAQKAQQVAEELRRSDALLVKRVTSALLRTSQGRDQKLLAADARDAAVVTLRLLLDAARELRRGQLMQEADAARRTEPQDRPWALKDYRVLKVKKAGLRATIVFWGLTSEEFEQIFSIDFAKVATIVNLPLPGSIEGFQGIIKSITFRIYAF